MLQTLLFSSIAPVLKGPFRRAASVITSKPTSPYSNSSASSVTPPSVSTAVSASSKPPSMSTPSESAETGAKTNVLSTGTSDELQTSRSAGRIRRMPVIYSAECNKHRPPRGRSHPERPERLDACVRALKNDAELAGLLDWEEPPSVEHGEVENEMRTKVMNAVTAVHRFPDYLQLLEDTSNNGGGGVDGDTYLSADSYEIALLAASAWVRAVDIAMDGVKENQKKSPTESELGTEPEVGATISSEGSSSSGSEESDEKNNRSSRSAWALVRPPGHHATPATGMGFCLLSNAAIAAKYAVDAKDATRVVILDFDVHHGNGTEAAVKNEEEIMFVSSHQWPLYPGTGREGVSGKYGNVKNINLEEGTGIETYRDRFENEMLPFLLSKGKPDLVVVSAGFDALDVDPLASLDFKPEDYGVFTQLIVKAVGPDTPIIFGLEGGYNLGENGLGAAVAECISGYCIPKEDDL